jgi:hypothetical protein
MEQLKVNAEGGISRTFGFLSFPFLVWAAQEDW